MENNNVKKNARGRRNSRIQTLTSRESIRLKSRTTIHNRNKLLRPRVSPRRAHTHTRTLCTSRYNRNIRHHFTIFFLQKFSGKNTAVQIKPRMQRYILCEPTQSKYTSKFPKSNFLQKFTKKNRNPKPRRKLYANLHNRFTGQYFTKFSINGHLQVKNHKPK